MEIDSHDNVFNDVSLDAAKAVHFDEQIDVEIVQRHVDPRPKHKVKQRRIKIASKDTITSTASSEEPSSPKTQTTAPYKMRKLSDKDRHQSRSGKGRGLPKKGGAGGKGTWGRLTEVYDDDGHTHDTKDPNYDSEEEEDTYVVSPSMPHMATADFRRKAEALFKEYFENDDKEEVAICLGDFNIQNIKHEIVRILVMLAMEKKPHYCELASQLIAYLCGNIMNSREITTGFDALLQELGELSLDTPHAAETLGNFIARAVADECLPPAYVTNHYTLKETAALEALKRAKLLLAMPHYHARLEHVWGTGGGQQPMLQLINKIILILKEYLSSGDKDEVVRCLQELAVPHFHHEVVYEAVVLALEESTELCLVRIVDLFKHLSLSTVISSDQMKQGFLRLFGDMTELVLDVPSAYATLSKFMDKGVKAGFVTPELYEEMPQRGRKRFVSEGDGGAVKQPEY